MFGISKVTRLLAAAGVFQDCLELWKAHPVMRVEDAYKWLWQATRGNDQGLPDVSKWLFDLWDTFSPVRGEISQPLRSDGSVVRLQLPVCKAHLISKEAIAELVADYDKEYDLFEAAWRAFSVRLQAGAVAWMTHADWVELEELMRPNGYPPVAHSPQMERKMAPYVVLSGDALRRLLPNR